VDNPIVAIAPIQFNCYKNYGGKNLTTLYMHWLVREAVRPFKHFGLFAYVECDEHEVYSYNRGTPCPAKCEIPSERFKPRKNACPQQKCWGTGLVAHRDPAKYPLDRSYMTPGATKGFKMELTLPSGVKKWVVPVWLEYNSVIRLSCDPAELVAAGAKLEILEPASEPAGQPGMTSAPNKAPTLTEWSQKFNTMRYCTGYKFLSPTIGIDVENLNICHDLTLDLLRFLKPGMLLADKCLNYKCKKTGKCSMCKNIKKYQGEGNVLPINRGDTMRPFKLVENGPYSQKRSIYKRGDIRYATELRTLYNLTTHVKFEELLKAGCDHHAA